MEGKSYVLNEKQRVELGAINSSSGWRGSRRRRVTERMVYIVGISKQNLFDALLPLLDRILADLIMKC